MQTGVRSVRQLVLEAAEGLENEGVPEPAVSTEVLLSELLGVRRSDLALREEPLTEEQVALFGAWISRRLQREPVQRILGYAYFRNLRLEIDENTLIPRPDTESVVDATLEAVDYQGGSCCVLDIGTGSGAIAISIAQEHPSCDVHATDNFEGALRIARHNAARAEVPVGFHLVDLALGLDALEGKIDVIVCNPPYIRSADVLQLAPEVRYWDPHSALDGGTDGLDFYRRIFAETGPLLAEGADVVLEVGGGQAEDVLELGRQAGYAPLGTRADLTGTPRAVMLRRGTRR